MASLENLRHWIAVYINIGRTVCEFNNKPFNKRKFKLEKRILKTVFVIIIVSYSISLIIYLVNNMDNYHSKGIHTYGAMSWIDVTLGILFLFFGFRSMAEYEKNIPFFYAKNRRNMLLTTLGLSISITISGLVNLVYQYSSSFKSWAIDNFVVWLTINFILRNLICVTIIVASLIQGYYLKEDKNKMIKEGKGKY